MNLRSTRLVVNADDFGICRRINEGIAVAHRRGIVTAASLMAVGDAFEHAVQLSKEMPELDLGVHLSLVGGRPLLASPSLAANDGCFPADAFTLVRRLAAKAVSMAEVRAEWSVQIERLLAAGIRPSHLDSHQHVHVLPGLSAIARQLARQYQIPWLRRPLERPFWDRPIQVASLPRLGGLAALWSAWLASRLVDEGGQKPASLPFRGFLDGGRLDETRLLRLVSRLQSGQDYELMCHPGFASPVPAIRRWRYAHERELAALVSTSVRQMLLERGIRLCRFRDLSGAA